MSHGKITNGQRPGNCRNRRNPRIGKVAPVLNRVMESYFFSRAQSHEDSARVPEPSIPNVSSTHEKQGLRKFVGNFTRIFVLNLQKFDAVEGLAKILLSFFAIARSC